VHGTEIVRHVVAFGRVLREAGLEVGPGRVADAIRGLGAVDLARQEDVYFTLRQTLVSRRDDLDAFDRAFTTWFLRQPLAPSPERPDEPPAGDRSVELRAAESGDREQGEAELGASSDELLRRKNFAEMSPEELERARRAIAEIAQVRPVRRSTFVSSSAARSARAGIRSSARAAPGRSFLGSSSSSATSPAR